MEIGELIFIGFCSLAAINAVFFAVYVWLKKKRNTYASTILSLFLLIISFRITQMLLHDLQDDYNLNLNIGTFIYFISVFPLIGPLLFLYIKSITDAEFRFRTIHSVHFLPFFLIFLIDFLNRRNFPLSQENRLHFLAYCVEISFILIQFLTYITFSFSLMRKLIRNSNSQKLAKGNIDPYYIRNILWSISVVWILFAMYCVQICFSFYLPIRVMEAIFYSLFSYFILYYELNGQKITSANNLVRYQSSGLSAAQALNYKSLIQDYICKSESYKDHSITLGKLSKSISLTPHIVSQVINEQLACNFNDFINSYRIEEAKRLLIDERMKNITVASIAYDCGFNTLSAFNSAFKKFTGQTPSKFRLNSINS